MSISERDRHELYLAVEDTIGTERADTMMALLPPVGWADVATKHDLAALEVRLDQRFDAMDQRFVDKETFQREMRDLSQKLVLTLVGSQVSLTALLLTVVGLTR